MRLHKPLLYLMLFGLLLLPGLMASSQQDPTLIRFLNMNVNDERFVVFYVNDVAVTSDGTTPYTVGGGIGTTYISFRSGMVDFSVRDYETDDVLATQDDFIIEEGRILSVLLWQPISSEVPVMEIIDETDAINDVENEAVITFLLDTNLPLDFEVAIDGTVLPFTQNEINSVGLEQGEREIRIRWNGEQVREYVDLAYAVFPESEADLIVSQIERVVEADFSTELASYDTTFRFPLFANQSIFLIGQLDVSLENTLEALNNRVLGASTNYIYALGVQAQGEIVAGDEIAGSLPAAGLRHSYSFTPAETREYQLELQPGSESAAPSNVEAQLASIFIHQYDPFLMVFSEGELVGFANDSNTLGESLTLELTAGVTYHIHAASAADLSGGDYVLRVE